MRFSPAVLLAGRPHTTPKGMKCRTDPGFLRPRASSKVLTRKFSYASSSPEGQSRRRRWSGPRAWRTGKKRGIFPAFSQAFRARRPFRARACHRQLAAPRRSVALGRLQHLGTARARAAFLDRHLLVIPAPWAATGFYRWFIEHLRVPRRPNLGFTGKPGDIWYVFVIQGLCSYAGFSDTWYPVSIVIALQAFLSWMTVRWIVANISSEGHQLPFSFTGQSPWAYVGWNLLLYISVITIIGWAGWLRRGCAGYAVTLTARRRDIVFNASGLAGAVADGGFRLIAAFIIPIPWVLGWYTRWYVIAIRAGRTTLTPSRHRVTCVRAASLPAQPRPPACRPA